MPDETRKEGRASHGFATLAGVLIAFLLLAAGYVLYQAMHVLFPQNVYETALPAVISDTVDADGVLLFDESYVAGSGNLGYLAAVSAFPQALRWQRSTAMHRRPRCASS